jgi:hypothetical protein
MNRRRPSGGRKICQWLANNRSPSRETPPERGDAHLPPLKTAQNTNRFRKTNRFAIDTATRKRHLPGASPMPRKPAIAAAVGQENE